tara:strand:+ start:272 stop:1423 length:1152 start_codon:yes stop_codon:yes gene_type:complete
MEFSQKAISELIPTGERTTYRDPTKPNLELVYYKNGTRKFFYRSRNKAYTKNVDLGDQLELAMGVYDALFNIRHLPPEAPKADTVTIFRDNATINILKQRFIRDYCETQIQEDTKITYLKYINRLISWLETNKCRLSTSVCSSTEAHDEMIDFLDEISQSTPTTANRMKSCFSKMFKFGKHKKLVTANPVTNIPSNKENVREYYTNDTEISRLFDVWNTSNAKEESIDALRIICLTGMRTGELRHMTRDMIDFEGRKIILPGAITKNACPHMIALSQAAINILHKHTRFLSGDSLVFKLGKYTLGQVAERTSLRAGKKTTPHDLRKLFATLLASLGIEDNLISMMLNHKATGVTKRHYNFYNYESPRRAAAESLADKLITLGF